MFKKGLVILMVIICTMALVMPIYAEEMLQNGTFEDASGWEFWSGAGGVGSFAIENGEAKIKVENVGNDYWNVQLKQEKTPLVQGKTYVIKFDARSTNPRTIQVYLEHSGGTYTKYLIQDVELTKETASYTYEYTMTEPSDEGVHLVFCLGKVGRIGRVHTVYLDNVSLSIKQ